MNTNRPNEDAHTPEGRSAGTPQGNSEQLKATNAPDAPNATNPVNAHGNANDNGPKDEWRQEDWRIRARAFFRNPLGVFGTVVLLGFAVLAILAPVIVDFPRGYSADILAPHSSKHPFGTDDLGLSIFGQVVWGARVTMMVGVAAYAVALIVGVPLGLLAAYYRGRVDDLISGAIDVFLSLPALPLMILIARSEE